MIRWFFWRPERSMEEIVEGYARIAQVRWASPHPTREPDPAMEVISQPIDGERSPRVQQMTRELTMDFGRDIE